MSTRGSLTKCVDLMGTLFSQGRYHRLYIMKSSAGKYYTLLTSDEFIAKMASPNKTSHRLILCCTMGELRSILANNKTDLFDVPPGRPRVSNPNAGAEDHD